MKIVFDSDFDRGAWPGPLEGRSASASIDPLAASRRLLAWRDFLFTQGWRGEEIPGAPRLAALAAVTGEALPGSVDCLKPQRLSILRHGTSHP